MRQRDIGRAKNRNVHNVERELSVIQAPSSYTLNIR